MPFSLWGTAGTGAKAAAAMGKTASAAGGAAAKFASSLASIRKETWKAGNQMFRTIRDIDWEKSTAFFNQFYNFMSQFGVISEFLIPLMDIFDVIDASIIEAAKDEIIAWNIACADFGRACSKAIDDLDEFAEDVENWYKGPGQKEEGEAGYWAGWTKGPGQDPEAWGGWDPFPWLGPTKRRGKEKPPKVWGVNWP